MLVREISADHVFLACGYTDMRRGIDGLAGLVASRFRLDPCQPSLFIFCGRRCDRIKALLWDRDGFLLLYKRLDNGRFKWPRSPDELREIDARQLRWLLEGLSIDQPNAIRLASKCQ